MSSFPYTPNPANLRKFLAKIQEVGVPSNVTLKYLGSLGFKSSNDRQIPKVLQLLGFVDDNKVPTDRWRQYRDRTQAPFILADALRDAYGDLFSLYPDACKRTDEDLRNFFSSHTELSEGTIRYVIRTFKTLCELADFSGVESRMESQSTSREAAPPDVSLLHPDNFIPSIHIDIQIHISPDASLEQIEAIFKSMAKYIFHGEK